MVFFFQMFLFSTKQQLQNIAYIIRLWWVSIIFDIHRYFFPNLFICGVTKKTLFGKFFVQASGDQLYNASLTDKILFFIG